MTLEKLFGINPRRLAWRWAVFAADARLPWRMRKAVWFVLDGVDNTIARFRPDWRRPKLGEV